MGEALKNGDITAVFNAMKPERYKVKSIGEVVQNSAIISSLNQGQDMRINQKASEFLKELCADIDFSKAGYRPPLKEPLILARLDDETMKSLEILGYKLESNELKVSTQKQLFHGMRREKIKTNRAFSKTQFINMPKYIKAKNMYIEKECNGARFYWHNDEISVNYVYFTLKNGELCLGTYGITQKSFLEGQLKSQIIKKLVNGDGS